MAWLVCDAQVLASADVASTRSERRRGLLGRDHYDGALVLPRCRWVHTIGMRFPIDVAYLDGDGRVIKTIQMARHRIGIPVPRARTVIEAEARKFARWGLQMGDVIEIRTDDADHDLNGIAGNDGADCSLRRRSRAGGADEAHDAGGGDGH